jgi:DNA-binding transcriptional MocR family regulator
MTTWLPDLSSGDGPLYVRLADQIERCIESGNLAAGAKLPPQRDLAFDIGVTIGTVGRAYALARERGLVNGEVGRGTYVLSRRQGDTTVRATPLEDTLPSTDVVSAGALRLDSTAAPESGVAAMVAVLTAEICREQPEAVATYIRTVPAHWRAAGARWLTRRDWAPSPVDVVPTQGAHTAIAAVIGATTIPGDKIVFEPLTYASVARSAALIGRRGIAAAADEHGLIPDEFERLCAQQHPTLLFLMPAPQNPTLAVMPEDRRRAIAAIARKYQVWIIEDAVYGVLFDDPHLPLATIAPDRVFYVGGLSKAVGAGLRAGWVACPPNFSNRVSTAHKMITGGEPFLMSEIAARLVLSEAAFEVRRKTLAEIARRAALAREIFRGLDIRLNDCVPFLWLTLPEPWLSSTFKSTAAAENILIDEEDEYKIGRSDTVYHGVRVGFTIPSAAEVETGFRTLRRLVDHGMGAYDTYN